MENISIPRLTRAAEALLLLAATVFLSLHYIHLTADFPNHSPWVDWAKFTDEGWYGDAAIRFYQHGKWNVPGDFNPAAALPVWPLLEAVLFRFTGVSIVAVRALTVTVFGLILVAAYALLKRYTPKLSLAPAAAVLMLAVSPFCFVFTRLAILEPMLILLVLATMLLISWLPLDHQQGTRRSLAFAIVSFGILAPLLVFTKTTAVFVFPAIAWLLFARTGYSLKRFAQIAAPAGAIAAAIWAGWFFLVIRPNFLTDYTYFFAANAYTLNSSNAIAVLIKLFTDGTAIGPVLFPLGIATVIATIFFAARTLRNPLIPALALWAAGYAAFLVYHNNLTPRYYLVIAVPLTMLVPLAFAQLAPSLSRLALWPRILLPAFATAAVALITIPDAGQTIYYVRTPEYTFARAAEQLKNTITAAVAADPTRSPLLLSISGSELSLWTGIPSICDDFGSLDLPRRIAIYRPGWFASWNEIEDDKMDALTPAYRVTRVAAFAAMDDPERDQLILYRLDPAPTAPPSTRHRRAHMLQTSSR